MFFKMPNYIKEASDSPGLAWSQQPYRASLRGWVWVWGSEAQDPKSGPSSVIHMKSGSLELEDLPHRSLPPSHPHACGDWPGFLGARGSSRIKAPCGDHSITLSGIRSHFHPWLSHGQIPKLLCSSIVLWGKWEYLRLSVVPKIQWVSLPSHLRPFCPACRCLPGVRIQSPTKRIENHHKGLKVLGNLGDKSCVPTTIASNVALACH